MARAPVTGGHRHFTGDVGKSPSLRARTISSVGRALARQAKGQRFEPSIVHWIGTMPTIVSGVPTNPHGSDRHRFDDYGSELQRFDTPKCHPKISDEDNRPVNVPASFLRSGDNIGGGPVRAGDVLVALAA